jgi:hypothetical protein
MQKGTMILIGIMLAGCMPHEGAKSGTVRLRFVPAGESAAKSGASWSSLHPSPDGRPGVSMAMAHAGIGDTFPVKEDGGPMLFEVVVVAGDDDHLVLELRSQGPSQKIDLRRDKSESVQVGGRTYKLSYPSVYVAPTAEPSTTQAMLMVHRLP